MLYWLLLLTCAYASSVLGTGVFVVGQKWQIVLENPPIVTNTSKVIPVDAVVWDIDAFDANAATVGALHAQGKTVICYFSAGTYEPWRPDAAEFQAADKGASLAPQWPDENWLDIKSDNVKKIMTARIKMAAALGCDAVDPDNVDGYDNTNGLGLTAADAVTYVRWLATTAATYKMQVGLKNAQGILPQVMDFMAFCVNEQCIQYDQCDLYSAFITSGKPVFHIEYPESAPNSVSKTERNADCNPPGVTGLSTVMKNSTLGGWVAYCDGTYETTPLDDSGNGGSGGGGGNGGSSHRPPPAPKSTSRRTSSTMRTSARTSTSRSTSQQSTFRPPTTTARPPTTNPRPPATTSRSTTRTTSSEAAASTTFSEASHTSTNEAPSRTSTYEPPSRTSSRTSSRTTSSAVSTNSANGCKSKHYDQCGGNDWKRCTECEAPYTCKGISAPYYYQCV